MAMNEAQLNAAHFYRAWEESKRREARLMAMNDYQLNADHL